MNKRLKKNILYPWLLQIIDINSPGFSNSRNIRPIGDPTGVPVSPVVGRTETDDIPAMWSFITPAKTR